MKFSEMNIPPRFTLELSLEEAVSLWRIAYDSYTEGNENSKPFVDALYEFAESSNSYTKYLEPCDEED